MSGTLYLVGTPIGNLGDITLRALETLRSSDAVFAEDTRVTRKLLDRYDIQKPLHSYREAAGPSQVAAAINRVIHELQEGKSVAYVSDAGTPGLSDPGQFLVQRVSEAGFPVVPIPGPSAFATLVSVSGMQLQRIVFAGFLNKKKGHQTQLRNLEQGLRDEWFDGILLYESPERIIKLLRELQGWEIRLCVCLGRELTKKFEEIIRGTVEEALERLERQPVKGEISLLIAKRP